MTTLVQNDAVMTTLVQNDEGYFDRNDGVNDDVGTSEGRAFSRAKKQPRRKGTASAVPKNSRAEGASALPKAGVEAQPKRPVSVLLRRCPYMKVPTSRMELRPLSLKRDPYHFSTGILDTPRIIK